MESTDDKKNLADFSYDQLTQTYHFPNPILSMLEPMLLSKEESMLLQKVPYTLAERLENRLEDVVSFSGSHKNYCVGIVDIVGSTKVTANLTKEQITKYYSIFLNGMAMIAKDHGGFVVKSIGDSLLFYFPKTSNFEEKSFFAPLKCGMTMVGSSEIFNDAMHKHGLPSVKYRVSEDFGTVMIANSATSTCDDIFGSTVNVCNKINRLADANGMVIGNDMYQIVKHLDIFSFKAGSNYSVGLPLQYPVYSVAKR